MTSTIDQNEVDKFSKLSSQWWDMDGEFKILHQINPQRISYFKNQIAKHFNLDDSLPEPLKTLEIIDVGCGGGIVSQPLAKLGAKVTAIDASAENIAVAKAHNKNNVEYLVSSVEEIALHEKKYDCVLAIEIIEHVANIEQFIASCASILAPGGIMIISTLNKTLKSYLKAIIGAEYVLRWVPRGTHDWQRFIKPSKLSNYLSGHHIKIAELKGLNYNILANDWYLSDEIDTNYIAICKFIC